MGFYSKAILIGLTATLIAFGVGCGVAEETHYQTIHIETSDGLTIPADVYAVDQADAPVILLFHQARFSRGEYRSIAPRLNELGFMCIAIDQRSGDKIKGVRNDTHAQAEKLGMGTDYLDAYPDLEVTLAYAKKTYPNRKIIVWGSSYSAALSFVLATQYPEDIAAVLAFSPGAYFELEGRSIVEYAGLLKCPVFMTCSREEVSSRMEIFDKIPVETKTFFTPDVEGFHGSKALWPEHSGNEAYWLAVTTFLMTLK